MGRRKKTFTKNELNQIEFMAGIGLTQEDIAKMLGINADTLRKYAHTNWSLGKVKANAKIAQTAFEMAASGKSTKMTIFWLKTQCGWSEFQNLPESLKRIFRIEGNDDES